MIEEISNFLFPQKCCVCGKFCAGSALCRECEEEVLSEASPCKLCFSDKRNYFFSVMFDKNNSKTALTFLYFLKQNDNIYAQNYAARLLSVLLTPILQENPQAFITYIPRSFFSFRQYGFDQSERILRTSVRYMEQESRFLDIFRRSFMSGQHKTMNCEERIVDAKRTLFLKKKYENGNEKLPDTLIIFDDTITSGAMFERAAHLAKEAGVRKVIPVFLFCMSSGTDKAKLSEPLEVEV